MKSIKGVITILSSFLLFSNLTIPAKASEVSYTKDGLDVTLTTNDNNYTEYDPIKVEISVTNNNYFDVNNISISSLVPEGYFIAEDDITYQTIDVLGRGETTKFNVMFIPDSVLEEETYPEDEESSKETKQSETTTTEAVTTTSTETSSTTSTSTTTSVASTSTTIATTTVSTTATTSSRTSSGTTSNSGSNGSTSTSESPHTGESDWLFIVPAGALVLAIVSGKKNTKKMLSLVLATTIAGYAYYSTSIVANATNVTSETITLDTTVYVNEEEIPIQGYISYDKEVADDIGILKSSEDTVVVNYKSNVSFTINTGKYDNCCEIYLYDNNDSVIGTFNDLGVDGDETKNDGIYSVTVPLTVPEQEIIEYYAIVDTDKTNVVSITAYDMPNKNDFTTITELQKGIKEIETKYNGDIDTILREVIYYIDTHNESIKDYEVTGYNVFITFTSGLTYSYTVPQENTMSNISNSPVSVYTYMPCEDINAPKWTFKAKDAGLLLEDSLPNYNYDDCYIEESVTRETVKRFGSNSVVIWDGHGDYTPNGPTLITGELADMESLYDGDGEIIDADLGHDLIQGRVTLTPPNDIFEGFTVTLTSKFIDAYCGDLSNTFVFLSACSSGKDSRLAEAFLKKGAQAVVGFSETVSVAYASNMLKGTTEYMTTKNGVIYPTLKEAIDESVKIYGPDDGENGAKLVIFGGKVATEYRYYYVDSCNLSCKLLNFPKERPDNISISIREEGKEKEDAYYTTSSISIDGVFAINALKGKNILEIEIDGYAPIIDHLNLDTSNRAEMYELKPDEGSILVEGKVRDALTNSFIPDAKLDVYCGFNVPINTTDEPVIGCATDLFGDYTFCVNPGDYTIIVSKDGFAKTSINVSAKEGENDKHGIALMPKWGSNDYHIVLSWNEYPEDLDAHVKGRISKSKIFHVYHNKKVAKDSDNNNIICALDTDALNGFGPETISMRYSNDNTIYYYVTKYSASGLFSASNATVTIYMGDIIMATYNLPKDSNKGNCWNVFAIKDGKPTIRNTITGIANVWYAE